MKKSSIAVLISLSAFAGIASAQNAENGIQMSTDPARAAQIEEHARNVQAQPSTMQFDEASDSTRAPAQHAKGKHAHNAKHEKHEKSKSKAKKAHGRKAQNAQ
ncbi:hypothetical protein G3N59_26045 [Paraburkholderia sp. Ac-20340]|uniref:hypothetical protein n=1 Tax=Paraburkholderia sp. Ac-20340 TaxID=2703888 RepID=UPI00197D23DA|nr:hypothetical protein [Paraburkholderia sp. Ac-20340]MBN3856847.1 hypothetical protein [Paraburkholderia sp. Ac-20340]